MKKNLSVLICDDDRFYASGLQTLISTWAFERGLNANFADQFQLRARSEIIFISQSELSSYRLHALRMEMSTFRRQVFIIRQHVSSNSEDLISFQESAIVVSRQVQPDVIKRYLENALYKLESLAASSPQTADAISVSSPLTFRETQILRFLARGISHATVARYLQISEKTVSTHKRNIMTKLNISRTTELNYWLIDEGFFRPPPSFNAYANNRHLTNT